MFRDSIFCSTHFLGSFLHRQGWHILHDEQYSSCISFFWKMILLRGFSSKGAAVGIVGIKYRSLNLRLES